MNRYFFYHMMCLYFQNVYRAFRLLNTDCRKCLFLAKADIYLVVDIYLFSLWYDCPSDTTGRPSGCK